MCYEIRKNAGHQSDRSRGETCLIPKREQERNNKEDQTYINLDIFMEIREGHGQDEDVGRGKRIEDRGRRSRQTQSSKDWTRQPGLWDSQQGFSGGVTIPKQWFNYSWLAYTNTHSFTYLLYCISHIIISHQFISIHFFPSFLPSFLLFHPSSQTLKFLLFTSGEPCIYLLEIRLVRCMPEEIQQECLRLIVALPDGKHAFASSLAK